MTNAQHEKGGRDPDKIEAEILANERTFSPGYGLASP
jgi:hypothetical protein